MLSPDILNNFITYEKRFRNSVINLIATNPKKIDSLPEIYTLSDVVLGKLDIIKANLIILEDAFISELLTRFVSYYNEIDNTAQFAKGDDKSLSTDGIARLRSTLQRFNNFLDAYWDQIFGRKEGEDYKEKIDDLNQQIKNNVSQRLLIEEELVKLRNKTVHDANTITELKNQLTLELDDFKARYKDSFVDLELLKLENIFREEADNKWSRKFWTWSIGIISALLIGICFWFMCECWVDLDCLTEKQKVLEGLGTKKSEILFYYEIFKPVLLRIFILSIFILVLKFAIKNYNATMHNRVVNLHKANSLAAMLRVINTLNDEDTRNTLISTASKEIFLHQKTGYLQKDSSKVDLGLLEKLSSILSKGKE